MSSTGIVRLEKVAPSGWGWNMFLVPMANRGLLVHSPTMVSDDTFERIAEHGEPQILFAPNHFHYVHLRRFRERYPQAIVVASESAMPRLADKGNKSIRELSDVEPRLPAGVKWLRLMGAKAGEAWLSVPGEGGPTWLTCDAFMNIERPVSGMMGLGLRAVSAAPGFTISRTFGWLALSDTRAYSKWFLDMVEHERPRRLLLSHGEAIEGDDLPQRLSALVRKTFGG